ncbi:NLR family CARD domain-containing protein 3-like [Ambystoma mexicanum]|uniref:NLR family CARD domain-containing protein 3-like n=1 Tax=Ambystoma mexicanum TaxID=8296 RepID=UPI0037E90153
MAGGDLSKSFADSIETHVSRSLSIPLIGSALCEIYREASTPGDVGALTTCSSVIFCLFQITVSNALAKMGSHALSRCAATTEESEILKNIQNTIHRLCEMSYKNIITGVQEIKTEDLVVSCPQAEDLLRSLRGFFFRGDSKTDRYVYRHSSIRDMFAALHCVEKIQDEEELEECLDTWALEKMPNNTRSPLLEGITALHGKRFQSFLRFFFGLLTSGKQSFLSQPAPLSDERRLFLKMWFQVWIERHPIKIKLLNLFHYVFELHDADVTEHVSQCIKSVDLFNTSLSSLDIHALLYCCERSQLDVVDLRLCELGDSGLKQMKSILRSSKKAYLSSNNLTAESGKLLGDLLEDEACAIENLVLGTNALGNEGAVQVFRGLGKNKRLITLSLNDNNISTLDKKNTALSLKSNQTLQELRLCMNLFRKDEIEKIRDLQNDRPKLKIVMRITEDEGVFHYTEKKVEMLSRKWKECDASWVLGILNKVKGDLKYAKPKDLDRVEQLEAKIKELEKQLSGEQIGSSPGTSKM